LISFKPYGRDRLDWREQHRAEATLTAVKYRNKKARLASVMVFPPNPVTDRPSQHAKPRRGQWI